MLFIFTQKIMITFLQCKNSRGIITSRTTGNSIYSCKLLLTSLNIQHRSEFMKMYFWIQFLKMGKSFRDLEKHYKDD